MLFKTNSLVWMLLLNFIANYAMATNVDELLTNHDLTLNTPEKRAAPIAAPAGVAAGGGVAQGGAAQQGAAAQQGVTTSSSTTPAAAAAAAAAATTTTSGSSTTTPAAAAAVATTTTSGSSTTTPAAAAATSKTSGSSTTTLAAAAATTTTSGSSTTTPAAAAATTTTSGSSTTTPAAAAATTTTSGSSTTTPAAAAAAATTKTSGSSSSPATTKVSHQTTRPDPSTNKFTPPPKSPVTNLSMETLATLTDIADGKTKIYTTTREHTSNMWVTVTIDGTSTVIQTTFAQRFTKQYDKVASPKAGSIGLGSVSGKIGVVKSQLRYTLSSNGVIPQFRDHSIFFSLVALLTWLL